jgi:predicted dehydrogenase
VTGPGVAPVTLAVLGAGNRGNEHGDWALANPDRARVVAVAEPRQVRRDRFAARHAIPAGAAVADWRELAARGRLADAVLVCTQDAMHVEPAVAFAEAGYHVLLEKPMATTEDGCRRIVEVVERAGVLLAVCHVLRYTPYTALVKRVVDAGRLGQVISVQHLEPVGFLHQAHSYVRGNWRNQGVATFMLMSKSCHDLDWLQYVVGRPTRAPARRCRRPLPRLRPGAHLPVLGRALLHPGPRARRRLAAGRGGRPAHRGRPARRPAHRPLRPLRLGL